MNPVTPTVAREDRRRRSAYASAAVTAAAMILATAVYVLIQTHVIVDSPPPIPTDAERAGQLRIFFGYFVATSGWNQCALVLSAVGFAALFVLLGQCRPMPSDVATDVVRLGSALYLSAQLLQAGAYGSLHDAAMRPGADLEATLVGLHAVDAVDDAFEIGSYVLLGLGVVGLARRRPRALPRLWAPLCGTLAFAFLALAGLSFAKAWTAADVVLVLGGAMLLPAWALVLATSTPVTATATQARFESSTGPQPRERPAERTGRPSEGRKS